MTATPQPTMVEPAGCGDDDGQADGGDDTAHADQPGGAVARGGIVTDEPDDERRDEVGQRRQGHEAVRRREGVVEEDRPPGRRGRVDHVEEDEGEADEDDAAPRHPEIGGVRLRQAPVATLERRGQHGEREDDQDPGRHLEVHRRQRDGQDRRENPTRRPGPVERGHDRSPDPVLEGHRLHVARRVDGAHPEAVAAEPDGEEHKGRGEGDGEQPDGEQRQAGA
jgi:hypothetical protein